MRLITLRAQMASVGCFFSACGKSEKKECKDKAVFDIAGMSDQASVASATETVEKHGTRKGWKDETKKIKTPLIVPP